MAKKLSQIDVWCDVYGINAKDRAAMHRAAKAEPYMLSRDLRLLHEIAVQEYRNL